MSRLVIRMKGEIESSNFEEWKSDFISQIQSINTELATDDDFVEAADVVKRLKSGEKALKEAKQAAINQSLGIHQLFAAIDAVASEARQTRLALEQQIRTRKQEIKQAHIEAGIERVRQLIAAQNEDFRSIDPKPFLDATHFQAAIKGKAGTKGVTRAIDELIERIGHEISKKAAQVDRNATVLATLSTEHQLLFQDRGTLLDLTEPELLSVVDQRIATFNDQQSRLDSKPSAENASASTALETSPEATPLTPSPGDDVVEDYQVTIELKCTKQEAIELARSIRAQIGGREQVMDIRLARRG